MATRIEESEMNDKEKQIEWLERFIVVWDKGSKIDWLCNIYKKFITKNNLSHISADDLICQLMYEGKINE